MELETVEVISRNDAIRGKSFDVYYFREGQEIIVSAIEDVTGTTDLKELLSEQAMYDIKFSLNEILTMRRIRNLMSSYTQEQINAGFLSNANENNKRGWTND